MCKWPLLAFRSHRVKMLLAPTQSRHIPASAEYCANLSRPAGGDRQDLQESSRPQLSDYRTIANLVAGESRPSAERTRIR
jgi:hypothetical protein